MHFTTSNIIDVSSRANTFNPPLATVFITVFSVVRVALSFVFYVVC